MVSWRFYSIFSFSFLQLIFSFLESSQLVDMEIQSYRNNLLGHTFQHGYICSLRRQTSGSFGFRVLSRSYFDSVADSFRISHAGVSCLGQNKGFLNQFVHTTFFIPVLVFCYMDLMILVAFLVKQCFLHLHSEECVGQIRFSSS